MFYFRKILHVALALSPIPRHKPTPHSLVSHAQRAIVAVWVPYDAFCLLVCTLASVGHFLHDRDSSLP